MSRKRVALLFVIYFVTAVIYGALNAPHYDSVRIAFGRWDMLSLLTCRPECFHLLYGPHEGSKRHMPRAYLFLGQF